MKNRRLSIFLATYFLAIFLWLAFCYGQVQKACLTAGHTVQDTAFQVVPFENMFDGREPFWQIGAGEAVQEKPHSAESAGGTGENAEAGEIAAALETPGEAALQTAGADSEIIRVVLLGEEGIYHEKVVLEAEGERLEIAPEGPYFAKTDVIKIRLTGKEDGAIRVASLNRACGHPAYEGTLEVRREADGLVLINELPLEAYVRGVLPSEMPSAYPLEALKAQAVCARTYAKMRQENMAYPQYGAAVDDGTSCQVYRNLDAAPQGDRAVLETAGEVLRREDGSFAECYYYSTSCGRGTTAAVWHGGETERPTLTLGEREIADMNQAFFDYISQKYDGDIESGEAFYRWEYRCEKVDTGAIFSRCADRQAVSGILVWAKREKDGADVRVAKDDLGKIKDMLIAKRGEGGVADCLKIVCEKGEVYVWGEYNIRYVLAQGGEVKLQNGAAYQARELLPSAFISLQSICNGKGNVVKYIVTGGGFGHGVGLSQNGAKQMAIAGSGYREILEKFYGGKVF